MSESRFSDPYTCINCGKQLADNDTKWVNQEPPSYLYPGYTGDPLCHTCYAKGPGVIEGLQPDTVEEAQE